MIEKSLSSSGQRHEMLYNGQIWYVDLRRVISYSLPTSLSLLLTFLQTLEPLRCSRALCRCFSSSSHNYTLTCLACRHHSKPYRSPSTAHKQADLERSIYDVNSVIVVGSTVALAAAAKAIGKWAMMPIVEYWSGKRSIVQILCCIPQEDFVVLLIIILLLLSLSLSLFGFLCNKWALEWPVSQKLG